MTEPPEPGHRRIRSYVRRTGRLTPAQERALNELGPLWTLAFDERPLDLPSLFGREAPTVLEIGFGNGDSMTQQASEHPELDYLGIDVHEPGVGHCLLRIRELGLENVRLMCHDAIDVLEHSLPENSLARINLYFPDPWPKKRHHKRRILQPPFLALCKRALAPDGSLHIATDWAGYAEHIESVMKACDAFVCRASREHDGDAPLDRPRTRFEQRGLRRGHRIHDWIFVAVQ